LWLFEPASGSVIAKAILAPVARPGSHALRCSSVPNRAISSPQMAAETRMSSSGLADDRELGDAASAAPVVLGQVDAEEAQVGDGLPQLLGLLAAPGPFDEVRMAEPAGHVGDGLPQQGVLGTLGELHPPTMAADVIRE
jgi:hypothetical protein